MKRVLFMFLAVVATPLTGIGPAHADSTSGSCSGSAGHRGYFYAHTYQSAFPDFDGTVGSWETHDFFFMGFLDAADNARMLGARDSKWVIYRASDFDLAVPYVEGAGLFLLESRGYSSNLDDRNGNFEWIKLCDY
ncbi:hypothetical protein ACIA8C_07115 [Nocardia sp. NPDC051321]|uniref:hypothetical protein n=1 Tax=Nocardia sp. NPDC051321 TaxID=3364323 RepID=UPI0037A2A182